MLKRGKTNNYEFEVIIFTHNLKIKHQNQCLGFTIDSASKNTWLGLKKIIKEIV